jgi:hypothetical protein
MFENFKVFFSNKKNFYAFFAALVILGGIFLLNRYGLYEGMKAEAAEAKAAEAKAAEAEAPPAKKATSAIIMNQMQ